MVLCFHVLLYRQIVPLRHGLTYVSHTDPQAVTRGGVKLFLGRVSTEVFCLSRFLSMEGDTPVFKPSVASVKGSESMALALSPLIPFGVTGNSRPPWRELWLQC